jgi:hypothetical protein
MHHRLTIISLHIAALLASAATLHAQQPDPSPALAAVSEAMAFRRDALGDPLVFDACAIYERTGRPRAFLEGIRPGLRNLLDRPLEDPCSAPCPMANARTTRVVVVDSVVISDSLAQVHLSVRRGEWSYREVHHLRWLGPGRGWAFREVRITNPIRITPPPPPA